VITTPFPTKEVREFLGISDKVETFYAVDLSPEELRHLVELGAADIQNTQNESLSIGAFLDEFGSEPYQNVVFIGYVVLPPRHDARVSVEGVMFTVPDAMSALNVVVNTVRLADELSYEELPNGQIAIRAWWD
jgi:hypothetical protein